MSLKDIAERLGVSKATVSMALNHHPNVAAKTRRRVEEAAEAMGYQRSGVLSEALRSVRSRKLVEYRETLGCIIREPKQADNYKRLQGLSDQALRNSSDAMAAGLVSGARRMGCAVDFFSTRDYALADLAGILRARGIKRLLLFSTELHALVVNGSLSESIRREWMEHFACCHIVYSPYFWTTGTVVMPDLFDAGRSAFHAAWLAGYRDFYFSTHMQHMDREGHFEAGFRLAGGDALSPGRVRYLSDISAESVSEDTQLHDLVAGMDAYSCIIGGNSPHLLPLMKKSLERPNPPGVIGWDLNPYPEDNAFSGVCLNHFAVAERAVEICAHLPLPDPENRKALNTKISIQPSWIDGQSLPRVRNDHINLLKERRFHGAEKERKQSLALEKNMLYRPVSPLVLNMNLSAPPVGKWALHDIPFSMVGWPPYTDVLIIGNRLHGDQKSRAEAVRDKVTLPVGRKLRSIYFLQTAGYAPYRRQIAKYRFFFRSHSAVDLPIITHGRSPEAFQELLDVPAEVNVHDWYPQWGFFHSENTHAVQVFSEFRSEETPGYLYVHRWENPHPDDELTHIEMTSAPGTKSLLLVYAVTLGL